MPYLFAFGILVVVGVVKVVKGVVNSQIAWGDFLFKGKKPWDDKDNLKK